MIWFFLCKRFSALVHESQPFGVCGRPIIGDSETVSQVFFSSDDRHKAIAPIVAKCASTRRTQGINTIIDVKYVGMAERELVQGDGALEG